MLKVCTLLEKIGFFGGFLTVNGFLVVFSMSFHSVFVVFQNMIFFENHEKTMKKL